MEHVRRLSDEQNGEADRYLALLRSSPYSPPTDSPVDPEVLSLLVDQGRVVKVSESVVFDADAYQEMVVQIKGRIEDRGEITVADVRDMFGASRKYSLALLDHMDKQRITRRVGDSRILR